MEGFLLIFGIFLVFVLYFSVGGVGGVLGRLAAPVPPPSPARSLSSFSPSIGADPRKNAGAGFSRADALAEIDQFYANSLNVISLRISELVPDIVSDVSIVRLAEAAGNRIRQARNEPGVPEGVAEEILRFVERQSVHALRTAQISRTLRDLKDAERAALRLADMLQTIGRLSARDVLSIRLPVIWNDGRCGLQVAASFQARADRMKELRVAVADLISGHCGPVEMAIERTQSALRATLEAPSVASGDKAVLERYLFGGAKWQSPEDPPTPAVQPRGAGSPTELVLGQFDGGREFTYDMAESLITIATPGAGKSQAHVLRNLLRLRGGAMVLDVKGEMFEASARWRGTLGAVARFAPGRADSVKINPLDWVRADPAHVWDDAQRLASVLYVEQENRKQDSYFEPRATTLITVVVAYVAHYVTDPELRTMFTVVSILHKLANQEFRDTWTQQFTGRKAVRANKKNGVAGVKGLSGDQTIPQLAMEIETITGLPDQQREGVIDGTRNMLSVWLSPEVKAITDATTYQAAENLRRSGTLYLCVNDVDIERLATVIRTILGVVMRGLMQEVPDRSAPIVTFFIDEMPRLKRMPLLETMLDLGRGYGIRLWLFAQNFGQLRERYKNADGLVKNCAARCYMNLDLEDALEMSKLLGQREGLLDGRRKPLVEHWELAGPEFADKILVLTRSGLPAKLNKIMAFNDPVCRERMKG